MADFEDDSSLLAILLDVSPAGLARLASTPGLGLQSLLEQLLTFVNAFTLLNDANRLAVFTAGASRCQLAYCSPSCLPPSVAALPAAAAADAAWPPSAAVLAGLQQAVSAAASLLPGAPSGSGGGPGSVGSNCQLSSALSRALCFIHSQQQRAAAALPGAAQAAAGADSHALPADQQQQQQQQSARVLCLAAAPDVPSQYIAVMNAIFSAQRSGVLIDACQLGRGHSAFLQQAAYLTGGVYIKPSTPQALIQYLNSVFALDARTRSLLRMPGAAQVDFRPSCFCHKRQIDLGFVCSACLSIFCEDLPACTTCGTDFSGKQKP